MLKIDHKHSLKWPITIHTHDESANSRNSEQIKMLKNHNRNSCITNPCYFILRLKQTQKRLIKYLKNLVSLQLKHRNQIRSLDVDPKRRGCSFGWGPKRNPGEHLGQTLHLRQRIPQHFWRDLLGPKKNDPWGSGIEEIHQVPIAINDPIELARLWGLGCSGSVGRGLPYWVW